MENLVEIEAAAGSATSLRPGWLVRVGFLAER